MEGQPLAQTKEERFAKQASLKKTYHVVLTLKEGEIFDKILSDNGCTNASQLIKKICRDELEIRDTF
jgi:hypothetical protein|nr:MAG TPA_asm: hypothetical protein [Caudoviricetes sp.]